MLSFMDLHVGVCGIAGEDSEKPSLTLDGKLPLLFRGARKLFTGLNLILPQEPQFLTKVVNGTM